MLDIQSYTCTREIQWAVETDGIMLIQPSLNRAIKLGYPEAALWDLLSRCLPQERIIVMIATISGKDRYESEEWVSGTCNTWLKTGLIQKG
jgi:hypothetical protein